MKLSEILSPDFRTFQGSNKAKVDWLLPSQQMVRKCHPDQKARHIDLLDFYLESAASST